MRFVPPKLDVSKLVMNQAKNFMALDFIGDTSKRYVEDTVKQKVKAQFLLHDTLHKNVYVSMSSLQSYSTIQQIETETKMLQNRLKDFAGGVDPSTILRNEIHNFNFEILQLVKTAFADVNSVSEYLFQTPGKRLRPLLNLLINKTLTDCFPDTPLTTRNSQDTHDMQNKMVEAAELIHTASMMHDDVVDQSETRRGKPSTHRVFGYKKAILGGDFLLARACRLVASFGIPEVFQRTASIVESLVKGELIQAEMRAGNIENVFRTYLDKTYHKTAALMAESSACGAVIGGFEETHSNLAFELGSAFGMAFQVCDDLVDYTESEKSLGKPVLNDISIGIVTSPLLLASFDFPKEIMEIINDRPTKLDDINRAIDLVRRSTSIPRTHLLVCVYATRMLDILQSLPHPHDNGPSVYARGLAALLETNIPKCF